MEDIVQSKEMGVPILLIGQTPEEKSGRLRRRLRQESLMATEIWRRSNREAVIATNEAKLLSEQESRG
jgi:hypothetical protein